MTRIIRTRKGAEVESPYSDREVVLRVGQVPGKFAADLARKSGGNELRLSDEQINWCHVLVVEHEQQKSKPVEHINDLSAMIEIFEHAATTLQRPKFRMLVDNQPISIFRAGPLSQHPGAFVVMGSKNKKVYGRILLNSEWHPTHSASGQFGINLLAALREFALNPVMVATNYGQITGSCCFCGLLLTDSRSVVVGYGPICAERWGLPWGDQALYDRAAALEQQLKKEMEDMDGAAGDESDADHES